MRKVLMVISILVIVIFAGLFFLERKAVNAKPPSTEIVVEVEHVLDR